MKRRLFSPQTRLLTAESKLIARGLQVDRREEDRPNRVGSAEAFRIATPGVIRRLEARAASNDTFQNLGELACGNEE